MFRWKGKKHGLKDLFLSLLSLGMFRCPDQVFGFQVFLPAAALLAWLSCTACCYAKLRFRRPYPLHRKLCQLIPMGVAYLLDISPVAHRLATHSWMGSPALPLHFLQVVPLTYFFSHTSIRTNSCIYYWLVIWGKNIAKIVLICIFLCYCQKAFCHFSIRWCCLCYPPSSSLAPFLSVSPPATLTLSATATSSSTSCCHSAHWPSRRHCSTTSYGGGRQWSESSERSASCWLAPPFPA